MFKIKNKETGEIHLSYACGMDEEGFVTFLLYLDGEFGWYLGLRYEPVEVK